MKRRSLSTVTALALAGLLQGCSESGDTSIAFSGQAESPDPVVVEIPLIYIERDLATDTGEEDAVAAISAREMSGFIPGATLILRDRASVSAPARRIAPFPETADEVSGGDSDANAQQALGLYDIRDLEADYDGSRVTFSMRGPLIAGADEDEQPTWNIWTYNLAADELSRVVPSDTVAEAGHDRDPHFLPDGRILFTSTRQRRARAILLDEGRPQYAAMDEDRREPAFNLHTVDPVTGDIEQLTFNQSHDQDPTVLDSGEIVFTRWDNVPGRDAFSLYRMQQDGTGLELLYGYHSQNEGPDEARTAYFEPREIGDGRLVAAMRSPDDTQMASNYITIDYAGFIDSATPTWNGGGSAGQAGLIGAPVLLQAANARGHFASVTPLWDGTERLLVSWSQCRLNNNGDAGDEATGDEAAADEAAADEAAADEAAADEDSAAAPAEDARIVPCTDDALADAPDMAPPLFGLWILDPVANTQRPVVAPQEGVAVTEAVVLTPRSAPAYAPPAPVDPLHQVLLDDVAGALHIRSVYDMDGIDAATPDLTTLGNPAVTPASARPARWLRIVKPVSLPDRDLITLRGTAFGRSSGELMREIVGYAPIHPDGSVFLKVPANVPFAVSITDAQGRRTSARHRNWLQVRPGEVLTCNGCHADDSTEPHGRPDAQPPSINVGGPFAGLAETFEFIGGETMAQAFALSEGPPAPAFDLEFTDIWTDPALRTPDSDAAARYSELATPGPVSAACASAWIAPCCTKPAP